MGCKNNPKTTGGSTHRYPGLNTVIRNSPLTLFFWLICFLSLRATDGTHWERNSAIPNDTTDTTAAKQAKPWNFGAMGGVLFSTIEGDLTEQHSYIVNFNAGIYGEVEIFQPLGLMVELYYAGLGTGFVSVSDSKLHFNYLVLPVLLTYHLIPSVTLALGPYFGFLLKAVDEGDDFKETITDQVNALDVGVKISLYYKISEVVDLGVGFNRGFINTQRGDRVSNFKQYNQSLMLTALFDITKLLQK